MTRKRAIRLARKWAEGGVNTLREDEAQEYHKLALEALMEQEARGTAKWEMRGFAGHNCSCCGALNDIDTNFYPNCDADMREVE